MVKTDAKWTQGSLTPGGGAEAKRHGTGWGTPSQESGDRARARMAEGKHSRGRGWLLQDSPGKMERWAVPLVGDQIGGGGKDVSMKQELRSLPEKPVRMTCSGGLRQEGRVRRASEHGNVSLLPKDHRTWSCPLPGPYLVHRLLGSCAGVLASSEAGPCGFFLIPRGLTLCTAQLVGS